MILLDTNVVYYLLGISNIDNKFDISALYKAITTSNNYCVSSLSVFEILNHFRDDTCQIRRVFSFLKKNNISIIQNKYLPLHNFTLHKLSRIKTVELNRFFKSDFKKKILLETIYTTTILVGVYSTYTLLYCKEKWRKDFGHTAEFVYSTSLTLVFRYVFDAIQGTIEIGYLSKNCETELRKKFYELLENIIIATIPTIENSINNTSNLDFAQIIINTEKLKKQVSKKQTSVEYVSKKIKIAKGENPNFMKDMLDDFIKMISVIDTPHHLKKFIVEKFEMIVTNGEAYRKNDIVDKMLLDDLSVTDSIVTFDTNLQKYIYQRSSESIIFKNSYLEIQKYLLTTPTTS